MIVTRDGTAVHLSGCFRIVGQSDLQNATVDALFAFPDPHTMQPLVIVRVNHEHVAVPLSLVARALSASVPKAVVNE
jgi:hypothetical protein